MPVTTVGKILLKQFVPKDLAEFITSNDLDKSNIGKLFSSLVEKHPQEYKTIVANLARLGFEVSTRMGSTVKLTDALPLADKDKRFATLNAEISEINKNNKDKEVRKNKTNEAYSKFTDQINKDLIDIGIKQNKTLAKVVKAGARGSASQYRQTVFSPVTVDDAKGDILTDFPIQHSFAEGLTLPEYLAHTYGSRTGTSSTKLSTAKSGYLSKQLSRAQMVILVEEHDCGTNQGIEEPVTDKDSIGTYLAKPVGGYNKNTEITGIILKDLDNKGIQQIIIRSPITCQSSRTYHSGAVCQLCVGKREKGLPAIGDYVGLTAGLSLGESLSQGALSKKHSVGSSVKKNEQSGFDLINNLFNIPDQFPNKAPLAKKDGIVSDITVPPQGGHYVHVGKDQYYISPDYDLKVKKGQLVEEGDVLSDGIINPAEVVAHKGIGEGRKYFSDNMKKVFDNGGMPGINRRNFELIAKGLIDHVRITNNEGLGDYLPGQVASYQAIEKDYLPREGHTISRLDQARGKYLEKPELHYTIGTKINNSVIDTLKKYGVESVIVHHDKPDFEPEMVRLLDNPVHQHDWLSQLYSTQLEKQLIHSVNTGAGSSIKGPSPIAGLAYGVGFADPKPVIKKSEEEEELLSFE